MNRIDQPETEVARSERLSLMAFVFLVVVAIFGVLTFTTEVDPAVTDARADWIVATAAANGLNPWADLEMLASSLGTEYLPVGQAELGDITRVHPRTPGALLILWPLTVIDADAAYPVLAGLGAFAVLVAAILVVPKFGWAPNFLVEVGSIVMISTGAYLSSVEFGTQSTIVMMLVAVGWVANRRADSFGGGMALGLAMTLKLFPALLLVPFVMKGRIRAASSAVLVLVGLNFAGLVILGLNAADAYRSLSVASATWMGFSANGSLAMPLVRVLNVPPELTGVVVVLLAGFTAFAVARVATFEMAVAITVVLSILGSPLAWPHYDVLAFVVIGTLFALNRRVANQSPIVDVLLGAWVLLQMFTPAIHGALRTDSFTPYGTMSLAGKVILLVAGLLLVRRELSFGNRASPATMPSS